MERAPAKRHEVVVQAEGIRRVRGVDGVRLGEAELDRVGACIRERSGEAVCSASVRRAPPTSVARGGCGRLDSSACARTLAHEDEVGPAGAVDAHDGS